MDAALVDVELLLIFGQAHLKLTLPSLGNLHSCLTTSTVKKKKKQQKQATFFLYAVYIPLFRFETISPSIKAVHNVKSRSALFSVMRFK